MKAVFLDALTLGENYQFQNWPTDIELRTFRTTSADQLYEHAGDADILITNKVKIQKNDFKILKNLKLICISATGMDHIDLEAASECGVIVKNVTNYSTASVAQHTLCMALNHLHPLNRFYQYTSQDKWSQSEIFTHILDFDELQAKKWGIIGLGEIGKKVAEIVSAFGADVYYYSTSGKNSNAKYSRLDLNELLSTSDIISIHCPLNSQTKDLIKQKELERLKPNSLVINCGRGGIINESDLARFLSSAPTQSFALDVISTEPIDINNPLRVHINSPNLRLTPHVAWSSNQARELLGAGIIKNIQAFKSGKVL